MKLRSAAVARLVPLALCLAFLGSLVLPCFCAERAGGHGHCEGSEEGLRLAVTPCCCGPAVPSVIPATAKLAPASVAAEMAAGFAPASFQPRRGEAVVPADRPSHGPPAFSVLRI